MKKVLLFLCFIFSCLALNAQKIESTNGDQVCKGDVATYFFQLPGGRLCKNNIQWKIFPEDVAAKVVVLGQGPIQANDKDYFVTIRWDFDDTDAGKDTYIEFTSECISFFSKGFTTSYSDELPVQLLGSPLVNMGVISGPEAVNLGETHTFTFAAQEVKNIIGYRWYLDDKLISRFTSGTEVLVPFTQVVGSHILRCVPVAKCGSFSSSIEKTIYVKPTSISGIEGYRNVCTGSQVSYEVKGSDNAANFVWALPAGVTKTNLSNDARKVLLNFTNSGFLNIRVKAINQGGESQSFNLNIQSENPVKVVTSKKYTHAELENSPKAILHVNTCSDLVNYCTAVNKKVKLKVRLGFKGAYNWGSHNFLAGLTLDVTTTGLVVNQTETRELTITHDIPEQIYAFDLSAEDAQSVKAFVVQVRNYALTDPANSTLKDDLIVEVSYDTEKEVNIHQLSVKGETASQAAGSWKGDFSWTPAQDCNFPIQYQFQIIHVKDASQETAATDHTWEGWKNATNLFTAMGEHALSLTLAEGSGKYVWRVRPVGTLKGGKANAQNYGAWSAVRHFNFTQPDDLKNWIYSRILTEDNKQKEQMTFANGLQQVQQQQTRVNSQDELVVSQTVQDYSGRNAVQSLPIPFKEAQFGYKEKVLTTNGDNPFTAASFDQESNLRTNNTAQDNTGYYSGALVLDAAGEPLNERVASAEGYPYNRTLFTTDGTGRVKEQAGPGATHSLAGNKTVKTYYTGVAGEELSRLFGKEAPEAKNVHKVLTVDANNVTSVQYQDKNGKSIATALSLGSGSGALEALSSAEGAVRPITQEVSDRSPLGTIGSSSSVPLVFTTPTEVTINYSLVPNKIEDACLAFCNTCDYRLMFIFHNEENAALTKSYSFDIPAGTSCEAIATWAPATPIKEVLEGSYVIEKRLIGYAKDPADGKRYFDKQLADIQQEYENIIEQDFATFLGYLNAKDIDAAYAWLLSSGYTTEPIGEQEFFRIPLSCEESILLPYHKDMCEKEVCDTSNPAAFREYFNQYWSENGGEAYVVTDPAAQLIFAPAYTGAEFDALMANMLADLNVLHVQEEEKVEKVVSCAELWDNWKLQVHNYKFFRETPISVPMPEDFPLTGNFTPAFDFLKTFFNGFISHDRQSGLDVKKIVSIADYQVNKIYAYKYLFVDFASPQVQDIMTLASDGYFCDANIAKGTDCSTSCDCVDATCTNFESLCPEVRRSIKNALQNGRAQATEGEALAFAESQRKKLRLFGLNACEKRKSEFALALRNRIYERGLYIEGDKHEIAFNDLLGTYTASGQERPDPTQFTISECEFEDYVNGLVAHCKGYIPSEFSLVKSPLGKLLGVGTEAEIANLKKVLNNDFDVQLPDNAGNCSTGYEEVHNFVGGGNLMLNPDFSYTCSYAYNDFANSGCFLGWFGINRNPSTSGPENHDGINTPVYIWTYDLGYTYPEFEAVGIEFAQPLEPNKTYNIQFEIINNPPLGSSYIEGVDHFYGQLTNDLLYTYFTSAEEIEKEVFLKYESTIPTSQQTPADNSYVVGPVTYETHRPKATYPINVSVNGVVRPDVFDLSLPVRTANYQPVSIKFQPQSNARFLFIFIAKDETTESGAQGISFRGLKVLEDLEGCTEGFNFEKLCFKWEDTQRKIRLPQDGSMDNYVYKAEFMECNEVVSTDLLQIWEGEKNRIISKKIDAYKANYQRECAIPQNLNEHFSLSYDLGYHHYTLYYYDRSGNLMRTVPPAGVDNNFLGRRHSEAKNSLPAHTLVTNYYFNSLGQIIRQATPDAGETRFYYDDLGQLRFSQNAQQKLDGTYSYSKFDQLGRIVEVGESTYNTVALGQYVNTTTFPDQELSELTRTVYNQPAAVSYLDGAGQRYLQNRISYTYLDEDGDAATKNDRSYVYYSYDVHGNVEWLVQDVAGLGKNYIAYDYDLLSSNVRKVRYNEGKPDQFFHQYTYDADNRILAVQTSRDGVIWEQDASYDYYAHGPLKRMELGQDGLQGVDYTYTIQGWLKGLNHPSLALNDPGKDGVENTLGKDAFGMALTYFNNDYVNNGQLVATKPAFGAEDPYVKQSAAELNLYNGNIAAWTAQTKNYKNTALFPEPGLTGQQFSYDELNRIKKADFFKQPNGASFQAGEEYAADYSYDANGNLLNLNRNAHGQNPLMDRLSYHYYDGTNKLRKVGDTAPDESWEIDVDNQIDEFNYTYDAIGNLVVDKAEGISNIEWTVYGKVKAVHKTDGSSIAFAYDASGNRIRKEVNGADGNRQEITFYVRDASGNTMAVYKEQLFEENNPDGTLKFTDKVTALTEQPIYGSDRLGQRKEWVEIRRERTEPNKAPFLVDPNITLKTAFTNWVVPLNTESGSATATLSQSSGTPSLLSSSSNLATNGLTTVAMAENKQGELQFSFAVAEEMNGQQNMAMVLDKNGNLMPGSAGLTSGRILAAAKAPAIITEGNSNSLYSLFTIGANERLYRHKVDMKAAGNGTPAEPLGEVIATNELLDSEALFAPAMASISLNGGTDAKNILYLLKKATDGLQLVSYSIGSSIGSQLEDSFSGNAEGTKLQLDRSGSYLAVLTQEGQSLGWYGATSGGSRIRTYQLDTEYNMPQLLNAVHLSEQEQVNSMDFASDNQYLYFTSSSPQYGHQLERVHIFTGVPEVLQSTEGIAELRSGNNGSLYVAVEGSQDLLAINHDATSPTISTQTLALDEGNSLSGALPLQPITRYLELQLQDRVYTRQLDGKLYELKDHLGNIRAVITDRKLSTITNGLAADIRPDVTGYHNYYPFGMDMPGLSKSEAGGGYRYGFNGKEKDTEGMGGGGSTYDYGFRIYNPQIAKFLSVDPLAPDYPWYTPYQFSGNMPINSVDLDGLEEANANEIWHYGGYGTSDVGLIEESYIVVKNQEGIFFLHKIIDGKNKGNYLAKQYHGKIDNSNYILQSKYVIASGGVQDFSSRDYEGGIQGWRPRMKEGAVTMGGGDYGSLEDFQYGDYYWDTWSNPEILLGAFSATVFSLQPKSINPSKIRFSQSSINGTDDLIASMRKNGWIGDPIDVVKMRDGGLTSIDNTRVLAASEAGIDVKAVIHNFDDPLPKNLVERFTTKKGTPSTWGEAIELRIGKQKATYRNNNPSGSKQIEGKLTN